MQGGRRPAVQMGMLLAAGLALLLAASGCAERSAPPQQQPEARAEAPPSAPPVATLRVAYASTGLSQAYVWLAQEAGYFAEEGLAVELQYVPGSNVANQALLAQEIQFLAGAGTTSIGAALGGADTVILATMTGTFVINIMATPDVEPTPESVRGRTVAVTRIGSTSDFVARYWLRHLGLEPVTDVPIVQVGGNAEMVAALASGAAQIVSVTDLFGLELQRQGYRLLADMGTLGVEYVYSGVGSTRSYVAAHEDIVRRYLRAAIRGQARFVADPAFSVPVVSRYTQIDDTAVLRRAWERHTTQYLKRIPYTTPAAVRTALEELALTNERARTADPEQFYDNRFVRELEDAGFFAALYPS
jgi:ABC-type nitrate/sulfonate/bicarbonate transport system substrate-binding protein